MLPEGRWRTQSGRLVWISDMATRHLQNARRFAFDPEKLREIDKELGRRKRDVPYDWSNFA